VGATVIAFLEKETRCVKLQSMLTFGVFFSSIFRVFFFLLKVKKTTTNKQKKNSK